MLHEGDRVWVNIPHVGYVGVGIVSGEMQQAKQAVVTIGGEKTLLSSLPLKGNYFYDTEDPCDGEFIVPITWIKTVPKSQAVRETGFCRPQTARWQFTIDRLKALWNIP